MAAGADVLRRLVEAALRGVQPARDRAAAAACVVVAAAAAAMKIWKLIGGSIPREALAKMSERTDRH